MLFAEVIREAGKVRLTEIPAKRFVIVDGEPVRFIAEDGTLLGVRRFVWGKTRTELARRAREGG